ncbi:MAG: branched-chain amino acid ABC transporter permease [Anaerolineae bacterium]|nr:branched-chain amino acid ABC transporter permease [Anaerolineae bacterium]MDQ7036747.1 branched-chain amino acid ABC transporter permease [Anaerolineae bacterium]
MASNIRPAGVFDTSYNEDMAIFRTRGGKIFWSIAFLVVLLVPLFVYTGLIKEIWTGTIIRLCILIIAVQGLNILIGYTGQISLGHSAFTAVGAYTAAIMGRELGLSFWLVLPLSALFTGFVGLIFGLPSLRVKGFYLAMATLAAQFIIPWVLEHPLEPWTNGNRPLTVPAPVIGPFPTYETFGTNDTLDSEVSIMIEGGHPVLSDYMTVVLIGQEDALPDIEIIGADGITLPNSALTTETDGDTTRILFIAAKEGRYTVSAIPDEDSQPYKMQVEVQAALSFASDGAFFYIAFPLTIILLLAGHNIIRTRTGRAFISVRDNDLAAELLGINVFNYKLQAFFLSAVYAGISGTLLAYETNSLSLDFFSLGRSIEMLAMVVIGGAGFPLGAIFGAAFFNLFNDVFIPSISPILRDTLPNLLPFVDVVNIYAAINPILFGLALMIFLILEPRGIAYRWEIIKIAWKIRPYSY